MTFKERQLVHIDTDNEEWGRVAGDGTIEALYEDDKEALVSISIQGSFAGIIVPFNDIHPR
jgi:hypothetical protein